MPSLAKTVAFGVGLGNLNVRQYLEKRARRPDVGFLLFYDRFTLVISTGRRNTLSWKQRWSVATIS